MRDSAMRIKLQRLQTEKEQLLITVKKTQLQLRGARAGRDSDSVCSVVIVIKLEWIYNRVFISQGSVDIHRVCTRHDGICR